MKVKLLYEVSYCHLLIEDVSLPYSLSATIHYNPKKSVTLMEVQRPDAEICVISLN